MDFRSRSTGLPQEGDETRIIGGVRIGIEVNLTEFFDCGAITVVGVLVMIIASKVIAIFTRCPKWFAHAGLTTIGFPSSHAPYCAPRAAAMPG